MAIQPGGWPARAGAVAVAFVWALATSSGTEATADVKEGSRDASAVDNRTKCAHGTWDGRACQCDPGWATAGLTDTIDFLQGRCEQYRCRSNKECKDILQIESASCPVPGWNCYCGFGYAFQNSWHGFDTFQSGGAECMGVMYTFSVWGSRKIEFVLTHAWFYFVVAAAIALPFGKKRALCDHHWPSMWNVALSVFGHLPLCPGNCAAYTGYSRDNLKDDVAWSLYILELGVWAHLVTVVVYVIVLFVWSIILWVFVFVCFVCFLCVGMCMACGEGAAALGSCDLPSCSGGCCNDCGDCCNPALGTTSAGDAVYFYGGTMPYDPFWGYSGYSRAGRGDCCEGCCCVNLCTPLASLFWVFPAMPENMWGGLVGYFLLATHPAKPVETMYTGGSPFVDFFGFGWMRRRDLHGDGPWRRQVYDFIMRPSEEAASPGRPVPRRHHTEGNLGVNQRGHRVQKVGHVKVVIREEPFHSGDGIPQSSFDDYRRRACWICQDVSEDGKPWHWDMWLSCKHVFCERCSTQMMKRSMPCPLCRLASTVVQRAPEAQEAEDDSPTELLLSRNSRDS